ncbi:tRNA methyltransferase 10 homolog A [Chelonus insularis]|uniref:tRNA methyltransferase 10 homolog A n=1 Tax=Chelonus insularis TaxID=460826 RepID=UPI00158975EC|nr:tRNA methyltransferase 10 homolog A [Chelonus insularis]XP_034949337.1 tRNA methyltransferase 10 homolog A [Chelonus insularis]
MKTDNTSDKSNDSNDVNTIFVSNSSNSITNDSNVSDITNLSKRHQKKIKKKEKWLARKTEKRLKERIKLKEKRAFARSNNIDLGPSRKSLKKSTMADSTCGVTITIDMSFDDVMIDKDIAKLIKQILRCYSLNRRALAPVQFSLTNFNGRSQREMEKHNGYQHWDVNFFSDSYKEIYKDKNIIYLTSESENFIEALNDDTVYVIGGLVDHNSHKGLCHKLAKESNIQHGRLPLDKFLKMTARKVLTIDHVFEILLRITEKKTWQEAFLQVLPIRNKVQLIEPEKKNETEVILNDSISM